MIPEECSEQEFSEQAFGPFFRPIRHNTFKNAQILGDMPQNPRTYA